LEDEHQRVRECFAAWQNDPSAKVGHFNDRMWKRQTDALRIIAKSAHVDEGNPLLFNTL